jgi:tripartite-type tricarboxylate transporter receptor subunit TctC
MAVVFANVLVVHPSLPATTVAEYVRVAASRPGGLPYATSGIGGAGHLAGELLKLMAKTELVHVPYKGGGPAIAALVAGQVEAAFVNINAVMPQVKAGKLRALAVSSGKRSPLLPDVPTLQEQGIKGAEVQSWQAVSAPRGLPPEVSRRLHAALVAALKDPALRDQLQAQGFEVVADEPDHFRIVQLFEHTRYKQLIEARNIKAD